MRRGLEGEYSTRKKDARITDDIGRVTIGGNNKRMFKISQRSSKRSDLNRPFEEQRSSGVEGQRSKYGSPILLSLAKNESVDLSPSFEIPMQILRDKISKILNMERSNYRESNKKKSRSHTYSNGVTGEGYADERRSSPREAKRSQLGKSLQFQGHCEVEFNGNLRFMFSADKKHRKSKEDWRVRSRDLSRKSGNQNTGFRVASGVLIDESDSKSKRAKTAKSRRQDGGLIASNNQMQEDKSSEKKRMSKTGELQFKRHLNDASIDLNSPLQFIGGRNDSSSDTWKIKLKQSTEERLEEERRPRFSKSQQRKSLLISCSEGLEGAHGGAISSKPTLPRHHPQMPSLESIDVTQAKPFETTHKQLIKINPQDSAKKKQRHSILLDSQHHAYANPEQPPPRLERKTVGSLANQIPKTISILDSDLPEQYAPKNTSNSKASPSKHTSIVVNQIKDIIKSDIFSQEVQDSAGTVLRGHHQLQEAAQFEPSRSSQISNPVPEDPMIIVLESDAPCHRLPRPKLGKSRIPNLSKPVEFETMPVTVPTIVPEELPKSEASDDLDQQELDEAVEELEQRNLSHLLKMQLPRKSERAERSLSISLERHSSTEPIAQRKSLYRPALKASPPISYKREVIQEENEEVVEEYLERLFDNHSLTNQSHSLDTTNVVVGDYLKDIYAAHQTMRSGTTGQVGDYLREIYGTHVGTTDVVDSYVRGLYDENSSSVDGVVDEYVRNLLYNRTERSIDDSLNKISVAPLFAVQVVEVCQRDFGRKRLQKSGFMIKSKTSIAEDDAEKIEKQDLISPDSRDHVAGVKKKPLKIDRESLRRALIQKYRSGELANLLPKRSPGHMIPNGSIMAINSRKGRDVSIPSLAGSDAKATSLRNHSLIPSRFTVKRETQSIFSLLKSNNIVSFLNKKDQLKHVGSTAYRDSLLFDRKRGFKDKVTLPIPKVVLKTFGDVVGISVNTCPGACQSFNEDRVTVLVNAEKKFDKLHSKGINQCNYFGIYDGHGGTETSDFLKDKLHTLILNDFTAKDPEESIKAMAHKIDSEFLDSVQKNSRSDSSGSSALGLISYDSNLVFFSVGDSSAFMSLRGGKEVKAVTKPHRPENFGEMTRIFRNGGRIYR